MRTSLFTIAGLIAISGLAFTIIGIVIARSPYTHGNLSPQGYGRTQIANVGEEYPFEGPGLGDPFAAQSGDLVQDGRAIFFQYGCASCHGFTGTGNIVGDDLDDASPSEIRRKVRDGPGGMPAYSASFLSDDELENIVAFITSDPEQPADQSKSGRSENIEEAITADSGGLLSWIRSLMLVLKDGTS
ncbi:MAG: cytochrome c [Pirellulales bacterium]